ncbi:MAG: CDP-alcohol phosphatidyltransferase family protein [Symploca sp. SIO2E9]|nr:CDP-alcohol phosphatidyltransferase family protein [Symploca sp. SIO2E9]
MFLYSKYNWLHKRRITYLFFFFAQNSPLIFVILYAISYVFDALDGFVARLIKQHSRFGAGLDMILDRSSTTCLLSILAIRFPQASPIFFILISLDISSHYLHMLANVNSSHKITTPETHTYLLHLYYSCPLFLTTLCIAHELAALDIYAYSFFSEPFFYAVRSSLQFPIEWWHYFLGLSFIVSLPFALLKTIISLVQLIKAAQILAS